jgi:hypothetical protein
VGDDPRARLELRLELRHQLQVQAGKQVQRDDGRIADVGREQILVEEADLIAQARCLEVCVGFLDALGVDVDAGGAGGSEVAYGGDRNAAVS